MIIRFSPHFVSEATTAQTVKKANLRNLSFVLHWGGETTIYCCDIKATEYLKQ
jgi:hypothetical protein